MQLSGALLYVKDLERMKKFYGEMLGETATNQNSKETWAVFEQDGVEFALHAIPTAIAESIEYGSPEKPREETPVKLVFSVKDVEGEREKLESMGGRALRRPWQRPGEACDAVDPEGNIFQLRQAGVEKPD